MSVDELWPHIGDPRMMSRRSDIEAVLTSTTFSPNQVGATFEVLFTSREVRKYQIFARDDNKRTISWFRLPSEIPGEANAEETTISLTPLTETGESIVTWTVNVGADATPEFVRSLQLNLQTLLLEVRAAMFPETVPASSKKRNMSTN